MTMQAEPAPAEGGGIGAALTKKLGPLPAWGWAVAIAGSVILYRIVRGKGAFPASSGGTAAPVGSVATTIPGSETSALGQLSASDLAALKGAIGPSQTDLAAAIKAAGLTLPAPTSPAPSTAPKPAPTVNFAGTYTPFGTKFPDYIHTLADAKAWVSRALASGYKPKASTAITVPHTTWPY